jgi:hypothetical protein
MIADQPVLIEAYVGPEHPVRVVDAFFEGLDLAALETSH